MDKYPHLISLLRQELFGHVFVESSRSGFLKLVRYLYPHRLFHEAFCAALTNRHLDIIQFFLKRGPDINLNPGIIHLGPSRDLLRLGLIYNTPETLKRSGDERFWLDVSINNNDLDLFRFLLELGVSKFKSRDISLPMASLLVKHNIPFVSNHWEVLEYLLNLGVQINPNQWNWRDQNISQLLTDHLSTEI